jgi:hypothetical protein
MVLHLTTSTPDTMEYRDMTDDTPRSLRTVIMSGINRFGAACRLEHISEGWTPAGSCARWQKECYAYSFTDKHGTRGGQQYRTYDDALAHFRRCLSTTEAE